MVDLEEYANLTPQEQSGVYESCSKRDKVDILIWMLNEGLGHASIVMDQYKRFSKELAVEDPIWDRVMNLRVIDENAKVQPFIDRAAQRILSKKYAEAQALQKPIRWIIPKARKEGVTTWAAGTFYRECARFSGRVATIVGYSHDNNRVLRRIYKNFLRHDKDWLRPGTEQSNPSEIVFDSGSLIRVWTAGTQMAGRGDTIHYLHGSEVAYWGQYGRETLTSLLNAVPDPGIAWRTAVILESTGNGRSGVFYDRTQQARMGLGDYEIIFFPWFIFEAYRRPFANPEERLAITEALEAVTRNPETGEEDRSEEWHLKNRHDLSDEQLNWRRWKIEGSEGQTAPQKMRFFRQEYPATIDECFQASTGTIFEQDRIEEELKRAWTPIFRGDVFAPKDWVPARETPEPKLYEASEGPLVLYGKVRKDGQYAIGADCAEGVLRGDFSVATIYDRDNLRVVGEWRARVDLTVFRLKIRLLSKLFNDAYINPEITGQGAGIISDLKHTDRFPYLCRRQKADRGRGEVSYELGWRTSGSTKPQIIGAINDHLVHHGQGMRHAALLQEMLTFVEERVSPGSPKTRTGASEGNFDDRVMAFGLALWCHRLCPYRAPARLDSEPKTEFSEMWRPATREKVEDEYIGTHY